NGVRLRAVDVDAQDLAEQRVLVLAVAERVAATTSVAGGDVEVSIGPKADPATVVIGVCPVVDAQDDALGGSGCAGACHVGRVLRNDDVARGVGVVREEPEIGGKRRVEGKAQQAPSGG